MIASERSLHILNRINEAGVVDYKSIASELGVSEATIRRDFEKLESQGKLRRVHGGAVRSGGPPEAAVNAELSMRAKHDIFAREKQLVARAAAENVRPGECVYLDVGTSIAPLAPLLLGKPVRIVTASNLVLQYVTPESRAEVYLLGGRFAPEDQMMVGMTAEAALETFGLHCAFIGCMGFDFQNNTVYATDMESAKLKQIAIRSAGRSFLLADRSKLGRVGLLRVAGLDCFTRIYVNGPLPEGELPANLETVL